MCPLSSAVAVPDWNHPFVFAPAFSNDKQIKDDAQKTVKCPVLSQSSAMFICSRTMADYRGHVNPHCEIRNNICKSSTWGKYFVFILFHTNYCLSFLASYFYVAGESIFGGVYFIASKSV